MNKSRFTETQIVGILKEHEAGAVTKDLGRRHGVSPATFYNWKARFGGMEVSDVAKMRALEDENRRLKRIVADQALNIDALRLQLRETTNACAEASSRAGGPETARPQRTPSVLLLRSESTDGPLRADCEGRRCAAHSYDFEELFRGFEVAGELSVTERVVHNDLLIRVLLGSLRQSRRNMICTCARLDRPAQTARLARFSLASLILASAIGCGQRLSSVSAPPTSRGIRWSNWNSACWLAYELAG